ncbi:hypothetical protein HQ571_03800 [Candidatus Kuenenbacteria bacterium]|nr:hypothetical protein [Candidatus Kuenenbacteria bacterium]
MKKTLTAAILISIVFLVTGCSKVEDKGDITLSSASVKASVKGWNVHTNPAFRYELRYPTSWKLIDDGEKGTLVQMYSKGIKGGLDLKILGYVTYEEKYTLEEFYKTQPQDLFAEEYNYEREEVEIDGHKAMWFKNVKSYQDGQESVLIDLVAFRFDDRIVEVEIYDEWEESKIILNSMNFYGNNNYNIADDQVK